jgi:TonB family protein
MFEKSPSVDGTSTRSLFLSLATHGIAVIAIFAAHYTVESVTARREARVRLVSPSQAPLKRHAAIRAPQRPKTFHLARLPLPTMAPVLIDPLQAPVMQAARLTPTAAVVAGASQAPRPVEPSQPAVQSGNTRAQVQTGGFANVSASSDPTDHARPVSSAGFGDATIATQAVARRSVAYSGFGEAEPLSAPAGYRGSVRSSGFGDTVSVPPSNTAGRSLQPASSQPASSQPAIAAQILEKPRPIYTEEARSLHIEGEVQLEVLFSASGEIHILRVIRGLGHGLDENAQHAAMAIRFLPAKREGRAVDSTALVHIIFQLS